jgi:hypothetical protein
MILRVLPTGGIASRWVRMRRRCAHLRASAALCRLCRPLAPPNNDFHVLLALATPLFATPSLPAWAGTTHLAA